MSRGLQGRRRGDVLMEYVIINLLVLLPLIGASTLLFSPAKPTFHQDGTLDGGDYGVIGNAYVEVYQRVMCGLALPIP